MISALVIAALVVYVAGYIGCVIVCAPSDAVDGVLVLSFSFVWPLILIGWLVSRPFA